MIDIYVLNENLEPQGVIDSYRSLIWSERYRENGDCELYLSATDENISLLRMGYYLSRTDRGTIYRINRIEITTDPEDGNYMIVTGTDVKSYLDQRIIWNTSVCNGNVETFVRKLVTDNLISPSDPKRRIDNIVLGEASGLTDVTTEQVSYRNLGEKIREYCNTYGYGYEMTLNDNNQLEFRLYQGTDHSLDVIFSDDYENLSSTSYSDSKEHMTNSFLVGGQGEGDERVKAAFGESTGSDRYEMFVDDKSTSPSISYGELTGSYPGGTLTKVSDELYEYVMSTVDIEILDAVHLAWLLVNYTGTIVTVDDVTYYRISNIAIAQTDKSSPTDKDTCTLMELVYHSQLLSDGINKISGNGEVETFNGSVIPDVTFMYGRDYELGDIVTVENPFGMTAAARITEIVESLDEKGYSLEPKFEYIA